MSVTRTFTVTVVSTGSGNKYFIDGVQQATLNLAENGTYKFDQSDSSNGNHPLRFSTTSNGTHSGGVEYTTGVTTNGVPGNAGAYTQIEVQNGAPSTLYYYCTQHSGMGGQANTDGWGRSYWGQMDYGDSNVVETGWGRNTWGYQSWGDTPIITLTGLTATTSIGDIDELIEIKPGWGTLNWGQNGWGSVESAVFNLTGFSLTASLGTVVAKDVVGLTGLSADIELNSLSLVKSDLTFTLTGLGLIASPGLLTEDDHSVGLSGQSATITPGSLAPADIMGVTGLSADIDVGTLGFTSNPLTLLTGLIGQSSLGGITASPATLIATGSVTGTTALGTVTTTQLSNVFPEGQVATTSLNDNLILKYYQRLAPKTSTGYTRLTPKTSTGYTRKTP